MKKYTLKWTPPNIVNRRYKQSKIAEESRITKNPYKKKFTELKNERKIKLNS